MAVKVALKELIEPATDGLRKVVSHMGSSKSEPVRAASEEVAARLGVDPNDLTRLFDELAGRYPMTHNPVLETDKDTGKLFPGKMKSAEETLLEAARKWVDAKIIKPGKYDPMFPVEQRFYADPTQYDIQGNTLTDAVAKTEKTRAAHLAKYAGDDLMKKKVVDAYERGLSDLSERWYAMGQLEKAFIKELGPKRGRKAFKERFADMMAKTTGGGNPRANLLHAAYENYRKVHGVDAPLGSFDAPHPVGGRYLSSNLAFVENNPKAMSAAEHPKRFNFSANFLGDVQRMTLDEQMSKPLIGKGAPSNLEYGALEKVLGDMASEIGVPPAELQDVVWAGLKKVKEPGYDGKPMIQEVNEAIARTSAITGRSQGEVLKGFVRGNAPLYGLTLATIIGSQSDPAEAKVGALPEAVQQFGKTLRGVHYSKTDEPLRHLAGAKYGEGAKGAEAGRVQAGDQSLKDRTFFYTEGSRPQPGRQTPRPEPGVGAGGTYQVKVSGMYDTKENPLGLSGSELEPRLKELGFTGYYNPDTGMAVALQPHTEAVKLGDYRAAAEEAMARSGRLPNQPAFITAENIPDTSTEMGQWLAKQPQGVREKYTDEVEGIFDRERMMRDLGVEDYAIIPGYGSYEGNINPNTVIAVSDLEQAKTVADARGFVTDQAAVPFFTRGPAGAGPLGMRIQLADGIDPETLQKVYNDLGLDFTRGNLDALDFINFVDDEGVPFSQLTDADFGAKLDDYFQQLPQLERAEGYGQVGAYNETGSLWSGDSPAGPGEAGPRLEALRGRVKDYNERFRKQHGYASPQALAVLAATGAGLGLLAGDDAQAFAPDQYEDIQVGEPRPVEPESYSVEPRDPQKEMATSLFQGIARGTGDAMEFVFDAMEMPSRGLHGLSATIGVLAEGGGLDEALQRGATVANQSIDETAEQLGNYVLEKTENPYAAALMDALTRVTTLEP